MIASKKQLATVQPFGFDIIVLCGEKEKATFVKNNACVEHIFTPESNGCYWYGHHDGETSFVLYLAENSHLTLMHESIHLAHSVMDYAGVPISMDNTEIEAYLACHIYELCKEIAKKAFN